ncbi:hypothetical protein QUC31_020142 [Theobroma cacao]|nr:B3 DNA binding domain - like 10 [Theobroma cacao]
MDKSKGIENGYPEEYREQYLAALTVASFKYEKLSNETALALNGLKTKIVRQVRAKRNKPSALKEPNPTGGSVNAQNLPGTPSLCLPLSSYFPPDIPPVARLNGLIGRCSKPFEKQLTESDVKVSQCRLSLNKFDVQNAVMPLLKKEEDSTDGIPVKTYDANGKEYPMTFITWSSKFHVLKEGWMKFCTDHSLLAHQDFVTLWAFRNLQTGDLSFVITSRRLEVFEAIKRKRLN